ncbi:MAG: sigma-54 dependent transcriptional regulator [Thermodesulfobacteriota bacterium]|nr:sigma-54 dependent transcriptional regulator [Thermodesulfobacteriota bacterium]
MKSELQKSINVLVVDDEKIMQESCCRVLEKEGYTVSSADSGEAALEQCDRKSFDLVLLDLKMPGMGGIEALKRLKEMDPEVTILIMTGYPSIETAVRAIKLGAYDYITKPFTPDTLRLAVSRVLERKTLMVENQHLRQQLRSKNETDTIIGESQIMRGIYELVRRTAPTDSTVLITGESGTGKELVARAIHNYSLREEREFVTVDCSSLVETLLESELFGHVKGSFTGAIQAKYGSFELANGGTFFFDEVGNLSLDIQAKLLRVIQEKEIKPVGSEKTIRVDVRILAATNQDLKQAIAKRTFREDLYYRLNVVPIHIPPLRERKEDIPLLVKHFLKKYNKKREIPVVRVEPETLKLLMNYGWPGNVRELENAIERALILEDGDTLLPKSFSWFVEGKRPEKTGVEDKIYNLSELEKQHIKRVLDETRGHRSQTASLLGIDRKTLYQKIKKYGL